MSRDGRKSVIPEVGRHHLQELGHSAGRVPAGAKQEEVVLLRAQYCPGQLWEEGQDGRQHVGNAQVKQEVVHPGDLSLPPGDGQNAAAVADQGEGDQHAQDADLGPLFVAEAAAAAAAVAATAAVGRRGLRECC